jgi:tRNA(Leu) C34 or U34 (ribose-2'-O)-methylase TrmL
MSKPEIYGKGKAKEGKTPSIILINPKVPHNVGAAKRAASCFGIPQVWFTGDRISLDASKGERLPREERMKGYDEVELRHFDYPFEQFENATPVAVEVRENSESLPDFVHPDNPVYVFGPEDGSLKRSITQLCHRFVIIPTRHCTNLAAAVYIVLYDRMVKSGVRPELAEDRGFIDSRGDTEVDLVRTTPSQR